ncbi:hypothetical protein [Streptomyces sp. 058-1L]|uniref:hypothetical protein n=1 Tax=Streptomyces sp. 058-1L TaxID=2789266 RepID=UPI00397F63BD
MEPTTPRAVAVICWSGASIRPATNQPTITEVNSKIRKTTALKARSAWRKSALVDTFMDHSPLVRLVPVPGGEGLGPVVAESFGPPGGPGVGVVGSGVGVDRLGVGVDGFESCFDGGPGLVVGEAEGDTGLVRASE